MQIELGSQITQPGEIQLFQEHLERDEIKISKLKLCFIHKTRSVVQDTIDALKFLNLLRFK